MVVPSSYCLIFLRFCHSLYAAKHNAWVTSPPMAIWLSVVASLVVAILMVVNWPETDFGRDDFRATWPVTVLIIESIAHVTDRCNLQRSTSMYNLLTIIYYTWRFCDEIFPDKRPNPLQQNMHHSFTFKPWLILLRDVRLEIRYHSEIFYGFNQYPQPINNKEKTINSLFTLTRKIKRVLKLFFF